MIQAILDFIKPEYLLHTYGAIAIFVVLFVETGLMCFFLPGDSLLVTAGFFCAAGLLNIDNVWVLMAIMWLMTILGDSSGYFIGDRLGLALYDRPDTWYFKQKYISETKAFYQKHGNLAIIVGKFVPIVRSLVPVLAGVGTLPYRRYIGYSAVGATVWVLSMTLLGYYLVKLAALLGFPEEKVREYLHFVILGIILVSVLPAIVGAIRANLKNNTTH